MNRVESLDATIKNGIDGIYEFSSPPPKYVITEVKMNTQGTKGWKPKVSTSITSSGGSQMSDKWIRDNITSSVNRNIAKDILKNGYDSVLVGISKDNVVLESLNKSGKKIMNNITLAK